MRVGKVIGRIVLTQTYETLVGGRFLLVEVHTRGTGFQPVLATPQQKLLQPLNHS